MLAAIRPDAQDFALLLHLVGATIAFGGLLACGVSLLLARGETRVLRLGYFSLLLVTLPGWILNGDLAHPCRRLCRRGLGDDGQAALDRL
jgi:hypothetical protein